MIAFLRGLWQNKGETEGVIIMNQTTIGGRIKYHRKRLGLTQEQLAARMGVSAQAVSKWENDLSCPDISILPELAALFGISVDELLGKQGAEPVHTAEPIAQAEEKESSGCQWSFRLKNSGILFALFILTVGALLLVNYLCALEVSTWTVLWTTAVFYIGISGLLGGFSLFCLVLSLGGVAFLLSAYGILAIRLGWGVLLPAALLLWGASLVIDILFGKRCKRKKTVQRISNAAHGKRPVREMHCDDGYLHCTLNFGDGRIPVVVPVLRGGDIDSSFGEFTVDFSGCDTVAEDCELEVDNSFGSLTLLVPERFKVELTRDESFGATQVRGCPAAHPEGTIRLNADVSFGNLEIRYI